MKEQENNQPLEERQRQEEELEKVKQQQQEKEQEQEHQSHTISSPPPTMHSSPPPQIPSPPPDSPPHSTLSSDQASHNYVFSPPEVIPVKAKAPSPPAATVEVNSGGSKAQDGDFVRQVEESDVDGRTGGGGERRLRPNLSILRRAKRENIKRKTLLGFRIFGFVFCLVSLSVMAADKNQGWALDSFHRYKEFRYCLTVNVLGFVYSGFQVYDLSYSLTAGKHVARNLLRSYLDFSLDQILTYLLLSASSSAAFRVEDWESNWGKDKFPAMARASVTFSFLAFVAFALSSLISGYTLFNPRSSYL